MTSRSSTDEQWFAAWAGHADGARVTPLDEGEIERIVMAGRLRRRRRSAVALGGFAAVAAAGVVVGTQAGADEPRLLTPAGPVVDEADPEQALASFRDLYPDVTFPDVQLGVPASGAAWTTAMLGCLEDEGFEVVEDVRDAHGIAPEPTYSGLGAVAVVGENPDGTGTLRITTDADDADAILAQYGCIAAHPRS
ncbi:hypothetical protein [Cellulomonas sp.]|uniref:hypothetical protein n=1 Tax=Cellulomonas sp. TaxID=40001 RepID=UPI002585BD56|nr:hypothetical protein [Cellulomonas sp.]MCR6689990.1 hypothetical protein [Cellulomonas sp.]